MSGHWYCHRNGRREGPFSLSALKQLAATGEVGPEDSVWAEGMPAWRPAKQMYTAWGITGAMCPALSATPSPGGSHEAMARTSMILGIVGLLVFGVLVGPVAIVLASIAM